MAQLYLTLCNPMDCSMPDFSVHHKLWEPAQTQVHRVGDAIQPSHPLLSTCLPIFNHSQHQALFQWVSSLHHVAKILEFQYSISPANEYSGLISFRMNWFDLLAVQGTLKTLLQHHSSQVKPLITSQRYHLSGFFTVVHHACLMVGKFYSRSSRVEFLHKLCRTPLCTEFYVFFFTYFYLLNHLYPYVAYIFILY